MATVPRLLPIDLSAQGYLDNHHRVLLSFPSPRRCAQTLIEGEKERRSISSPSETPCLPRPDHRRVESHLPHVLWVHTPSSQRATPHTRSASTPAPRAKTPKPKTERRKTPAIITRSLACSNRKRRADCRNPTSSFYPFVYFFSSGVFGSYLRFFVCLWDNRS